MASGTSSSSVDRSVDGPENPSDLVDVAALDDSLVLDIRYATSNNFTGVAVYPVARCLLRRVVAERLLRVQSALRARGLGLKIWDCYRPISVQAKLWRLVPDPRYVAEPVIKDGVAVRGSKHNRGAAVDLTLVDSAGTELDMPTDYDDFTARAHRDYRGASPSARRNAQVLEAAMVAAGIVPLATEWWHFD
ncbi:MAG: M15 family metallopeptidase [Myxococcota bacterium]